MLKRIKKKLFKLKPQKASDLLNYINIILIGVVKNKYTKAGVILLLIVGLYTVLYSNFLLITDISCKTQYGPTCDKKDERFLGNYLNKKFFTTDSNEIVKDLKTNFVNENVFVQKILPDKIEAFIIKRKPIVAAKISGKDMNGYFLIDKEGVVTSFVTDTVLCVLNYKTTEYNLIVGSKVNDQFTKAARIAYYNLYNYGSTEGFLEGNTLIIKLPENINVHYPLDKDMLELAGALQLILTKNKVSEQKPKIIDFRFQNPVLTY